MLKSCYVLTFVFSQQLKPKCTPHWSMLSRLEKSWCESDGGWN